MRRFSDSEISGLGFGKTTLETSVWPDLSSPVIAPHCCHEIQIKITKDNLVTELSTVHRRCCKSISKHESAAQRPLPVEVSFARESGVDTVHGDINIAQRSKGSQHTDRQQQTSAPPSHQPCCFSGPNWASLCPLALLSWRFLQKRNQSWLILWLLLADTATLKSPLSLCFQPDSEQALLEHVTFQTGAVMKRQEVMKKCWSLKVMFDPAICQPCISFITFNHKFTISVRFDEFVTKTCGFVSVGAVLKLT